MVVGEYDYRARVGLLDELRQGFALGGRNHERPSSHDCRLH
jgi:hypothetical protein